MARRFSDVGVEPGKLKAAGSTPAIRRRYAAAALCLDNATTALRDFDRGTSVFGLTKGQFSMIDLAAAVLRKTGPAMVAVWTWCIAEYEVVAFTAFMKDGAVADLRVVMDWTGSQRDMPLIGELQTQFGLDCIRVTRTHAKIVTVWTECGWRVVIRGSMNLNSNPRFEQFDCSDDLAVFAVLDDMMREMWAAAPAFSIQRSVRKDASAIYGLGGGVHEADWTEGVKEWWDR